MADNYLEKKFESLNGPKTVIRNANASLDTLLDRLASSESPVGYDVKQAQADAIIRSIDKLHLDIREKEVNLEENSISIYAFDDYSLGKAAITAQLKAAELHLRASICHNGSGSITIVLSK